MLKIFSFNEPVFFSEKKTIYFYDCISPSVFSLKLHVKFYLTNYKMMPNSFILLLYL